MAADARIVEFRPIEKKMRPLKQTMMESTRKLLDAIPFLNGYQDETVKMCCKSWGIGANPILDSENLKEIRIKARKMILVAYGLEPGSKALEAWVTKSLNIHSRKCSTWQADNRRIGFEIYLDTEDFQAHLVDFIARAFDSSLDNGKYFIGACKLCKKIFQKRQSNAEYCGKPCMDAVFRTTKKK